MSIAQAIRPYPAPSPRQPSLKDRIVEFAQISKVEAEDWLEEIWQHYRVRGKELSESELEAKVREFCAVSDRLTIREFLQATPLVADVERAVLISPS